MKSKKKNYRFISVFFILIFIANFVSADIMSEAFNNIKTNIKETDFTKIFNEFPSSSIDFLKDALGYNISGWGYFFTGLLAGLWLWGIYFFIRIYRWAVNDFNALAMKGKDEEEITESRTRWLNTIAGRIWKPVLLGIGYAVIMFIPIINRIFQIITLEIIGLNGFFRSIVIAIEIGALPSLVEYYGIVRLATKLEKKVQETRKGAALNRAAGRQAN
ncbi:hypothetical protein HYW74_04815 [Candidatus Pacearchaeota archaeon]|nr:hypothetical protein [Candidatus Pacearchaeota archaeon]